MKRLESPDYIKLTPNSAYNLPLPSFVEIYMDKEKRVTVLDYRGNEVGTIEKQCLEFITLMNQRDTLPACRIFSVSLEKNGYCLDLTPTLKAV